VLSNERRVFHMCHRNRVLRVWTVTPVLVLFVALTLSRSARAELIEFVVRLDGQQANDCFGTGSPATGGGTLVVDTDTGSVTYDISVRTDLLLGEEVFAHVHGPAPRCQNAAILFDLPLGPEKQGSGRLNAQGVADMLRELLYMNIHTRAHLPGEIRGQIVRAPEVPAATPAGEIAAAALVLAAGLAALRGRVAAARRAA
jgi:hypothetical protein